LHRYDLIDSAGPKASRLTGKKSLRMRLRKKDEINIKTLMTQLLT
jgi:hypothetical protein